MGVKRKKMYELLTNNKGFTLIEMAIVLIIIGIIIGAVVKGKDIIRSAEQKKLFTKYVNAWEMAYNTYYDRTGWILGDVANDANDPGRDGKCDPTADCDNLVAQLKAVGVDAPAKGAAGIECQRKYTDSTGAQHTLTITFANDTDDGVTGNYNYIKIPTIPNELGIAWDRIVDGTNSGDSGDFVYIPVPATPVRTVWPSAQTAPLAGSEARLKLSF